MLFNNCEKCISKQLQEQINAFEDYEKAYSYPDTYFKYSFATIIDWIEGSHKAELQGKLKSLYKSDLKKVQKTIKTIDNLMTDMVKHLQ